MQMRRTVFRSSAPCYINACYFYSKTYGLYDTYSAIHMNLKNNLIADVEMAHGLGNKLANTIWNRGTVICGVHRMGEEGKLFVDHFFCPRAVIVVLVRRRHWLFSLLELFEDLCFLSFLCFSPLLPPIAASNLSPCFMPAYWKMGMVNIENTPSANSPRHLRTVPLRRWGRGRRPLRLVDEEQCGRSCCWRV